MYVLHQYSLRNLHRELRFSAKASRIDKTIDDLLLERLKATTVDETAWQTAIASTQKNGHAELRRVESDIRSAERAKAAILENLKMLQHPDMVRSLEASYAANQREIERLRSELAVLQQSDATQTLLEDVRPVLDSIIAHWGRVPAAKRRALFEALADYANVTALDEVRRELTVRWRDGSQTSLIFRWGDYRQHWIQAELERLREMVEAARPQVEIMKAFPHWNWSSIAFHYAYHFTTDRRFTNHYRGEKKYPYRWSWSDTTEYQVQQCSGDWWWKTSLT